MVMADELPEIPVVGALELITLIKYPVPVAVAIGMVAFMVYVPAAYAASVPMVVGEVKLPLAFDNCAINVFAGEFVNAHGIVKFTLIADPAHNDVEDTEVRLITSLFTIDVMLFDEAGFVPAFEHKLEVITHFIASEPKM